MKYFFALVFIVFSLNTISQEYAIDNINPLLRLDANAVIRKNDVKVWLHDYNSMTIQRKLVVTVSDKKVMDHLNFWIDYDNYVDVKEYKAILYDGYGKEVRRFKKRDFIDVSATGSDLYSDDRAIVLKFTPTFYPFTLEFSYEKKTSTTAFIPIFFPYPYPNMNVEESTFTLYNEKEIPIRVKKYNLDGFDVEIEESSQEYHYSVKNLHYIDFEYLTPSNNKIFPRIRLTPERFQLQGVSAEIKNWKDFGVWEFEKLLRGRDILDENVKFEIDQLVFGLDDPKEKTKRIYEYMQNKTRYISVQIGLGGLQPFPAKEVDKLGYGDCKGLTNYMMALLKTQNINSYYTLIDSGSFGDDLDEEMVSFQGDHAILTVPFEDETVFLECTSQTLPYNFLGEFTDNRKALMITSEGGIFIKTHAYTFEDNLQTKKADAFLDENLILKGHLERVSKGIKYDEVYGLEFLDQKDKKMHYKNTWGHHNGLSISNIELGNDKDEVAFYEKIHFESPSYTTKAGDNILLNPNLFSEVDFVPKRDEKRVFPMEIRRGYSYKDEISIQLPDNYNVKSLFAPFELESDFGKYKISIEKSDDTLLYKRELVLFSGQWPKERFNDYVDFIKQIDKKDKSKILLSKNL